MKQFVIGYLTSIINDIEAEIKARPEHRCYELKEHKEKLEGLLTAVEDMDEEKKLIIAIPPDMGAQRRLEHLAKQRAIQEFFEGDK